MQAPLDDLVRYCAIELPGAASFQIVQALNDSAIKLCRESACWNTWLTIPLVAGQSVYSLTPPEVTSRAFTVRKALINGREFQPMPSDPLVTNEPSLFDREGTPTGYYFSGINQITVIPKPTQNDVGLSIKLRVSWAPSVDSVTFDSDLMDRYQDALTSGAKFRLMRQPKQPWTNPQLALYYEQLHTTEIGKARIDQMHDMTVSSLSITPRSFG